MNRLSPSSVGKRTWAITLLFLIFLALSCFTVSTETEAREITANVVALDQVFFYNRLGVVNPAGMIFALRRDVVDAGGVPLTLGGAAVPGAVSLRQDKRPRPVVLRMNVGDVLRVNFQNLLDPLRADGEQPATRTASVHVLGMQLAGSIADDGSNVGLNSSSLVAPGGTATYRFTADREGTYLLYSTAAPIGGEGNGGSLAVGLFGAVNVLKPGAEYYRSQITHAELQLATTGATPGGHPIIDYDARYPDAEPYLSAGKAGLPIINMMDGSEIVHSDINAIITGPDRGNFPPGTYPPNPTIVPLAEDGGTRSRNEPFREFTVIFHDDIFAIQAFPEFQDPVLSHTLHSVRDGFAINYGTGGIGAEILANRKGLGPMANCTECKYEEFFLTSWAVGDPAMIVDNPANTGLQATMAMYPDDPSNVHHSYIGDHVKMRNLHAGPKEHHIFHLHAHQWLFNPDDDNSTYLDSQAVGPGSGYNYEITYNGSGNRNQTVGDAIFHCHFYPHFAQGMWELWRNHDVFEVGTEVDANGVPTATARALPDGEIAAGTPIPALVPIPGRPMAPMPGAVHIANGQVVIDEPEINPGYPFYIPALAGHRPPHPPLDTLDDGGLPRHVITGGLATSVETRLDFSKELVNVQAEEIPEDGTDVEKVAMAFHATRFHPTFTPDGQPAQFKTNGLPPQAGAPFADPCVDDFGNAVGNPRTYKVAGIQLDLIMNKVGWHFPQSRILALWGDVDDTLSGIRPPEPLFFRANTNDCIVYHHTNLIPNVYELDDFQVRTPTDIIGQHIHLVKFDVTSSDGSGNGFNYEDGTFSPQEVIERIEAINAGGGLLLEGGAREQLETVAHPYFGVPGAQTTIQRWFADDVLNNQGVDRTLRTVFTHDHFGPSTHQQAGLYASLVIEPEDSSWRHPETGQMFGSRFDGGPTSWRADILTADPRDSYREYMLQFADFQLAYEFGAGGGQFGGGGPPVPDPAGVINPPAKQEAPLPILIQKLIDVCPDGISTPPCPEAISAADVGTFSLNYRNEPVALRVLDTVLDPVTLLPRQAPGLAGDLASVYRSDITRAIPELNLAQPPNIPYPTLSGGIMPGDPFTPLIRSYAGDKIQVRIQFGATEEGHIVTFNGMRWLQEASSPNSGFRNAQMLGISEHFEFLSPLIPAEKEGLLFTDTIYKADASVEGLWNGLWGLMRTYDRPQPDLLALPNNPAPRSLSFRSKIVNSFDFSGVCPRSAPNRLFDITAVSASQALPGGTLVYNDRLGNGAATGHPGPLNDPTAILYVQTSDLDFAGRLRPNVPVEPLILRANAGDCIDVILRNRLPANLPDLDGFSSLPLLVDNFNNNQIHPSSLVGLHPQLVSFDASTSDGSNAGMNATQINGASQLAAPGGVVRYRWYAGTLEVSASSQLIATPVEFGATNLMPADPMKQAAKGAVGALIIEPRGATWQDDYQFPKSGIRRSRDSATVNSTSGSYREFVLLFQDDVNLFDALGNPIENLAGEDDAEDTGAKALNYRTEPSWFRMAHAPDLPLTLKRDFDFTNLLSNSLVGGDPATPVFVADAGAGVRFRVLQGGGHARNHVFQVHGHAWERQPHTSGSSRIGSNPFSQVIGAQEGMGPSNHFDMVLKNGAGGKFRVKGDYLYRNQASFAFDNGHWGILRVR